MHVGFQVLFMPFQYYMDLFLFYSLLSCMSILVSFIDTPFKSQILSVTSLKMVD